MESTKQQTGIKKVENSYVELETYKEGIEKQHSRERKLYGTA